MSRHITELDIQKIVEMLDGWEGRLTWNMLCEACSDLIHATPTRQTLSKFPRIVEAYRAVNERAKNEASQERNVPASMQIAVDRIERLTRENERLKRENEQLLEQFVVWQYNASSRGMSIEELNKNLPTIDRGQTD